MHSTGLAVGGAAAPAGRVLRLSFPASLRNLLHFRVLHMRRLHMRKQRGAGGAAGAQSPRERSTKEHH